jgi:hypothetical protein
MEKMGRAIYRKIYGVLGRLTNDDGTLRWPLSKGFLRDGAARNRSVNDARISRQKRSCLKIASVMSARRLARLKARDMTLGVALTERAAALVGKA